MYLSFVIAFIANVLRVQAKKREYNERILEVENGSFTPLVFGTNGGMGGGVF